MHLGHSKVSLLQRCPYFWGVLLRVVPTVCILTFFRAEAWSVGVDEVVGGDDLQLDVELRVDEHLHHVVNGLVFQGHPVD